MSATSIHHCTCVSRFQDKTYGPGMRVQNKTGKGRRCTVCSTETVVAGQIPDKAVAKKK